MAELFVKVHFNNKTNSFTHETNIKPEKLSDIIWDFLSTQEGKGKDERKPNEQEVYDVELHLDLSEDLFSISDNCGNHSLRDGILMYFARNLNNG